MVRWLRWHCPPDTGFEIRALAVWGRARYLSVTEAPHNTDFHTWMGKKHFCFFETAETGNRAPNSGVKGIGANHYPRAPARAGNHLHEQGPESTYRQIDSRQFLSLIVQCCGHLCLFFFFMAGGTAAFDKMGNHCRPPVPFLGLFCRLCCGLKLF